MWRIIVELDSPQMTIWCTYIACCITEATNTHLAYVILTAFPLQQWLHKHASVLHYLYITCLFICKKVDKYKCLYTILHTHTHTHTHTRVVFKCINGFQMRS